MRNTCIGFKQNIPIRESKFALSNLTRNRNFAFKVAECAKSGQSDKDTGKHFL